MAEITPNFVFERPGRPNKYPWEEWADGQARTLTRGADFDCEVEAFQNAVYVWARRHGLKGQTQRIAPDKVVIQMNASANA